MKIQNNYKSSIWWWSYRTSDTIYGIALAKGEVLSGKTKDWSDDSFKKFKLQIARDWSSWGINNYTTILSPGRIYDIEDNFIVNANGTVTKAEIKVTNESIKEQRMTTVHFRDRRGKTKDEEVEVVSEFSKAFTRSIDQSESTENSRTWNVGAKISGTYKGVKSALTASFESKVKQTLTSSYKEVVEKSLKETRKKTLVFEANKISMIKTVWLTQIKIGTISYFGEEASFLVPIGADSSSLEVQATFNDPDEMDAETRAEYDKLIG